MSELCAWEGCPNRADRGALCRTHRWRRQHHKPMDAPIRPRASPPHRLLQEAALAFADAPDAAEAWHRLRTAAVRYARAEKTRRVRDAHTGRFVRQ